MSLYDCIFYCELAIILSQIPSKRERAELHIDTKNKIKGAEITETDYPGFTCVWLMPTLNFGQICNTQNGTVALDPQVGKYQSSDPAESRVF